MGLTLGIPALRWLEEGDVYESEVHLNYTMYSRPVWTTE